MVVAGGAILLVDDDEAILEGLSGLLRKNGYQLLEARSGAEALQTLGRVRPAVVVLDLMLPDLDGFEICRRIRMMPEYTPIVMLTARHELADKLVGLEVGADAYLTKPFEPRELLAQVRAILRLCGRRQASERGEEAPPLVHGPLRFWEEQHRLEVGGRECELPPKEFELLRFLLRRPGQVFGRETLLREIWGYDFVGDSRTVDVHVQRLRARVETDPGNPQLLRTVRGFGYRLALPRELSGGCGTRP